MTKLDKLIDRFRSEPRDFEWSEMIRLLRGLGFDQIEGSGSRVCFTNGEINIRLHKPHPQKEVKAYAVRQVRELLEREGLI